jgi:hypothetical protein
MVSALPSHRPNRATELDIPKGATVAEMRQSLAAAWINAEAASRWLGRQPLDGAEALRAVEATRVEIQRLSALIDQLDR